MALRNLVLFHDAGADSFDRLSAGAAMAREREAHLAAVTLTLHPSFHLGYQSMAGSQLYFDEIERAHEAARAIAERAGAEMTGQGLTGDVRWGSDTLAGIGEIAAIHARYADLAIVAQPADALSDLRHAVIDGVLSGAGRPLLMLPRGWTRPVSGRNAVVAWQPTREAARAVQDAMVFLRGAGGVSIAIADPETGDRELGDEPGADIAVALARHGLTVSVDPLALAGRSVARTLIEHATGRDADLIVMGAYGHSRWREMLVGGVTREMIETSPLPVLLSS